MSRVILLVLLLPLSLFFATRALPVGDPVPGGGNVAPVDLIRLAGDSIALGDGLVRSWVEVDGAGTPVALGVTLPDATLASLPTREVMMSLDFPAVEGLPFRHVLFDWGPGGHPPAALYAHPHWDAHFYLITAQERMAIQAGEQGVAPAPHYLPPGYIPVPDLGLFAFPSMGVHWMHEGARALHGHTFDETLIYGSDGERVIFVEPMFTDAFLETRPDFSAPVPGPDAVQESGWYPTRYVIRYEEEAGAYRISLEGFRWRQGG